MYFFVFIFIIVFSEKFSEITSYFILYTLYLREASVSPVLSQREFCGPQQQTERGAVEDVVPEPVDHYAQFIAHSQD